MIKHIFSFLMISLAVILNTYAQDLYHSQTSYIRFFSSAPLEDIEAENKTVTSLLNVKTGDFAFKVNIEDFAFDKALMKEHFNENYMETDKFPHATFKGKITNIESIDWSKQGTYDIEVVGDLTIHGQKKNYTVKGTLERKDKAIIANSVFKVKLKDHKVKIPKMVFKNIAEIVEVTVKMSYTEYHKKK